MRHWLGFLLVITFFATGFAGVAQLQRVIATLALLFAFLLFAFVVRGFFRLLTGSPHGIVRKNLAPRQ